MLRNYFLIGFRGLLRNKAFTILNIFGLAFGMAIGYPTFRVTRINPSKTLRND